MFWQYIPKKHKRFGINIYNLYNRLGYAYNTSVYLGQQWQNVTAQIAATCGTVLEVIQRVKGLGHKILIDNYFTSPALSDCLCHHRINACVTIHCDRCGMP
jgi:hypothetical protein